MPQQKKTEGAEGLPNLTPNQLGFVKDLLAGKSATDAYRANYSVENQQDSTIWANASRLKAHSKVQAWLTAARREALEGAKYDVDAHMAELDEAKLICRQSGNHGAMVNAIVSKGKVAGLYVDQHRDVTEENPLDILDRIAKLNPDLARDLAKDRGIRTEFIHNEPDAVQ